METVFTRSEGHTIGRLSLGRDETAQHGELRLAHGDTLLGRIDGNIGLSLLGIDMPELALPFPGSPSFVRIDHPAWAAFLGDPFAPHLPPLELAPALRAYLAPRLGAECAANHRRHAEAAAKALEAEIAADLAATGRLPADFKFLVRFEREVIDAYGRLLGWIGSEAGKDWRAPTYNHRMMLKGLALPYFIWPNVAPFRHAPDLRSAVPAPGSAARLAVTDPKLNRAREWYKANREAGAGVFDTQDPLRLSAFELRYLAQRRKPDRWVIDLSKSDDTLLHPQRYHEIALAEDRLFVPDDYLELFLARGWHAGSR